MHKVLTTIICYYKKIANLQATMDCLWVAGSLETEIRPCRKGGRYARESGCKAISAAPHRLSVRSFFFCNLRDAMLLTIQFPFVDLRGFSEATGRLAKPGWPIPTPDDEFVRFSGAVRVRKRGGICGWLGENEVCEANRLIRLSYCPKIKDDHSGRQFTTRIAFRRLYFDGLAVGKFELGIATKTRRKVVLTKQTVKEIVDNFLNLPTRVRESGGNYREVLLGHSAQSVASLYYHATTKHTDKQIITPSDLAVRPGRPLLFLDCQSNEDVPVPYWSRNVKISDRDFDLYNCVVPFHGKNIQLWLLDNYSYDYSDTDAARRLRIYLLRLHAEHESLRLVLRGIMSKAIDVQPRSPMSDNLQYYINEATRRIGILDSQSSKQFEDEICKIARESMNIISPGKKDALVNVLKSIDFRPNILRKVEDYINKWGDLTINIEEVTMGDRYEAGQVGALGPNAHAHDMTFNQIWNQTKGNIDLQALSNELTILREELQKTAKNAEEFAEIGAIANAEIEAKKGDGPQVLSALAKAGKWALSVAEKIGIGVATAAIKTACGL
ncbi:hypothetical protein [Chloroherpeton thalassium]|nr:hypothetical protein [Chloroherpeton thalassium]